MKRENVTISGKQDILKSGCELTWEFLFPDIKMPRAVKLLGRFDVWDHSDPDTVPFQYGMNSYDITPNSQIWEDFLSGTEDEQKFIEEMIRDGKIIQRSMKISDAEVMKNYSFETEFEGLRAICLNSQARGSKQFESMWDPEKHDMMIKFSWDGNANQWEVSLYANDKEKNDLSVIAKKYGGGGHAGASGFKTKKLPFLKED
jgi:oligoribonuclease NrnB/cAMP/cGMP phosphodiesterase (DHH superfamily)